MGDQAIAARIDRPAADLTVARARSGDREAFERLYRREVGGVYGLCLRMTADPTRAEEHTQEAFVRAWRKLDSLRGDGGFGPWIRRIAINVVHSGGRSRGRRDDRERSLDQAPQDPPAAPRSPAIGLDLETAIAQLPPGARRVFVLHDVEGYGHAEIAGMLELTTGTSKSQLHRARRLLREALGR